jgi:hypothetical protein
MSQIVYNACRTPDGTILVSKHRHNYVTHVDKNGEEYMRDGGQDYIRCSKNTIPAEDLSVTMEDGHEKVREVVTWGTYGKDGDQPLTFLKVSEMSTEHIKALVEGDYPVTPWRMKVFKNELEYRNE